MKAQYVFEKFVEESDPIYDMGIGITHTKKNFPDDVRMFQYIIKILPQILKTPTIPNDIIKSNTYYINEKYHHDIQMFINEYCKIKGENPWFDSEMLQKMLQRRGFRIRQT